MSSSAPSRGTVGLPHPARSPSKHLPESAMLPRRRHPSHPNKAAQQRNNRSNNCEFAAFHSCSIVFPLQAVMLCFCCALAMACEGRVRQTGTRCQHVPVVQQNHVTFAKSHRSNRKGLFTLKNNPFGNKRYFSAKADSCLLQKASTCVRCERTCWKRLLVLSSHTASIVGNLHISLCQL